MRRFKEDDALGVVGAVVGKAVAKVAIWYYYFVCSTVGRKNENWVTETDVVDVTTRFQCLWIMDSRETTRYLYSSSEYSR